MGIWLGPRGKTVITENDFSYSGNYLFKSDGKHWELALLEGNAESLVFTKNPGLCDIFTVAGGQPGRAYPNTSSAYYGPSHGGYGGNGGGCVNEDGVRLSANTNYAVTIGTSGQNSSFIGGDVSITAVSGNGSPGGVGGIAAQDITTNATAGTDGVYAYNKSSDTLMFTETEFPGHLFGPGGGGAAAELGVDRSKDASGALGGESNGPNHEYGKGAPGGTYGRNGSNGYANHGQGGGGPQYWWLTTGAGASRTGDPGAGGSGVIFIRDAR